MGPGLISQPKINGPRNIFCINFPTICGPIWGRGRARGWGVGGWGVKGGTWKFPKLGPTHRWLSVGGGGVYVHMTLCKKWPKVNHGLKIVNYITCMWHFSCRWYRPPEVDFNWYPTISNPYCHDIQTRRCELTQGKKMTQSKSWIKKSKLFYMYAALLLQVVRTARSWFKWISKDL